MVQKIMKNAMSTNFMPFLGHRVTLTMIVDYDVTVDFGNFGDFYKHKVPILENVRWRGFDPRVFQTQKVENKYKKSHFSK